MSTDSDLAAENAELRARLAEAQETIEAIRSGAVDALVTTGAAGEQVFTLQGAETPYRLLMESMNEGAATLAADGTVLYCNQRFADMASLPAAQVVGSCICECVLPEQRSAMRDLIGQARSTGSKAEFTFSCAAGPGLPVLVSLGPIAMDSGSVGVVATDLSERKAHEEKLRQLNQELEETVRHRTAELQAIFDTAPVGLAIAQDVEGQHIRGNPAIEQALGLGRGDELSRSAAQPAPYHCLQDGRELPPEQLPMQRAARGETVTGYLMDIVRPDGATRTLHTNAVPLLDDQGRPRGSVGVFLDITERKQREAALRESEQRYRLLFDQNPDGVFAVDTTGRFMIANAACETISGYPLAELRQKTFMDLCAPDQLAKTVTCFERGLREGKALQLETALVRKDGRRVEVWVAGEPLSVGQQTIVHCTAKDTTERKQAEAALRQSEQRLKRAQQIANVGSWEWDIRTGTLLWSEQVYRQIGEQPAAFSLTHEDFRQRIHPEDRAAYEAALERALAGTAPYDLEFRIVRPDGAVRVLHTRGEVLFAAWMAGRTRMVGVCLDVTERKQAEQTIFAANQRLQALMEALPVGVSFSDDATCQRITGNPAVLAQFEVTSADNLSASAPNEAAPGRQVRFFRDGQPITDADLPLQRAVAENREIPPLELEVLLPSGRRWCAQGSAARPFATSKAR